MSLQNSPNKLSYQYYIMGRLVYSPVPLLAPNLIHSNLNNPLSIIESEPRTKRHSKLNISKTLRGYPHRNYLSYRADGHVKMRYTNNELYVEKGLLADFKYQMTLMKTVIPAICTLEKNCQLHASAIAFGDKSVLILGESGAGKSTTATVLEANGAEHLCDDIAPIMRKDNLIVLVGPHNGRMILPSIQTLIEGEIAAIQIGEGYPVGTKRWYPAARATKLVSYPIVGVVVLTEDGKPYGTEQASQKESGVRALLRSIFGPFDFSTHLAPTYLPIFGALAQQAHWTFERKPRSIDEMRLLALRIATVYQ